VHLGPLPSRAAATTVIEAIQSALPIRRCTTRIRKGYQPSADAVPCRGAQLGVAMCPCAGTADESAYWRVVAQAVAALTTSPEVVLDPLWRRVEQLSVAQRYEEAAQVRDRARAFAGALARQRLTDQLRAAGELEIRVNDTLLRVRDGVLVDACFEGQLPTGLELPAPDVPPFPTPLPRDAADEVLCLARALDRASYHSRLLSCSGEFALPTTPVREVTRLGTAA